AKPRRTCIPRFNYGTFLCRQGQYPAALTQFEQAAKDPNYLTPANSLENAGLCALLIPDQNKAIAYFQAALQKNPNMSTSILQLGEIYYSKGDFTQSYKYLEQYLKGNEPTAEALWLGIQLAYQRGDSSSANSYGLLLKSQFASSQQYQDYLKLKTSKGS
ncbi:MAG: tetratricopeptide repeat protein, partial [Gammaproteobacteria bacterium]|nr:tetratricopeptide repeat protein [Gammaproteobacteria bacterium]